jgi:hypothetical protein
VTGPDAELRRPPAGAGFANAVTLSWADRASELYGFLRLGIADGRGSALAVLFSGREPAGVIASGGHDVPAGDDWSLAMGGIAMTTEEPLRVWSVRTDLDGAAVDLRFEAQAEPTAIAEDHPVARAGGMQGYEQPCAVSGRVAAGGRETTVRAIGQRGHQWGAPDWERITLARTLTAWGPDGTGVALSAVRPAKVKAHDGEAVWAALLGSGEIVADPRLSTTYDAEGRQRRAGLELWVGEEDPYPRRATGEVLCGSTLDLGQLRLDCAFFSWRLDGDEAVGRYDVLRRT